MKLLLVSDLHRDGKKLLWILEDAPPHDAVLIAGDMLDIFSNTAMRMQIDGAKRYRDTLLSEKQWVVWCSGNHDFYVGENTSTDAASPAWMREETAPQFVRDGESRIIGDGRDAAIVTTVPWPVTGNDVIVDGKSVGYLDHIKALLHQGHQLRAEHSLPWIVLHHEPPIGTAVASGYDTAEAGFSRRIIEAAEPDFSLHGHIHEAPSRKGGSWIDLVGRTVCFNAGQSVPGSLPHAILLETGEKWCARWIVEGEVAANVTSDQIARKR